MGQLQDLFAEQLRRLRVAAGQPSYSELAKLSGVPRSSIGDLFAGQFVKAPDWDKVRAVVQACLETVRDEQGNLPREVADRGDVSWWRRRHGELVEALQVSDASAREPVSDTANQASSAHQRGWPRLYGIVPMRAGCFQRRDMAGLRALGDGESAGACVLSGMGGVGKTQFAADYAHTMWDSRSVDLLVWVTATAREQVVASLSTIAGDIGDVGELGADSAVRWLLGWLARADYRWLIVFDDLRDPYDLRGLWPPNSSNGQVVVTTRRRDAALAGDRRQIRHVDVFTPAESLAYLLAKLPAHASGAQGRAELEALANDLGHLPLALAQAAAFIIDKPLLTVAEYRARFADRYRQFTEVVPTARELPDEHEATVAATWSLSIDLADQLDPVGVARPALEFASLLDANGCPAAVFASPAAAAHLTSAVDVTSTPT